MGMKNGFAMSILDRMDLQCPFYQNGFTMSILHPDSSFSLSPLMACQKNGMPFKRETLNQAHP
jgi:hypothetical protein